MNVRLLPSATSFRASSVVPLLMLAVLGTACTAEEEGPQVAPVKGGGTAGKKGDGAGAAGGDDGDGGSAGKASAGSAGKASGGATAKGGSGGAGGDDPGDGGSSGGSGKGGGAGTGSAGGSSGGSAGAGAGGTSASGGKGGSQGTAGTSAGTGGTGSGGTGMGKAGSGGAAGGPPDPPDPTLAEVHPSGRYVSTPAGLRSSWSGSSLTTTFQGTGIAVTFDASSDATDYEVIVDGQRRAENKIELTKGEKSYPVVSGLPAGKHTVTVHRRTEASTGATVFKGFTVTGGALVATPSPFAHRIEFVGDSITCGYGTECKTASEAFSTKTENHWLTFGAGASRALAADAHFVAWSGKGMYANYGNDQSPRMPELFPRTFGNEATPTWDFDSWKPDVVVINLGTNDWNGGVNTAPEIETFKTTYRAFIDKIAGYYPGVVIFGVGNAVVGKSHTDAVKAIMDGYGSPSRRYILFSVKSAEGQGCYHPSAATHARWSDELAAAIKEAKGW